MSIEAYTRVMDLFTGILLGYTGGYFLWLFVHWYYDERPEKKHAELRARAINEYNKQQNEEVLKPTYTIKWDELDKKWEENMKIIKENNKRLEEAMVKASKKLQEHIEKEILSPPANPQTFGEKFLASSIEANKRYRETNPNLSPAKTSGEPEKEKPTSPPPPPSPLYNHLFHYERKPNA